MNQCAARPRRGLSKHDDRLAPGPCLFGSGAFHLLFSITRAPWRGIVGLLEVVHSRHHLDLN
jgi:hypothetical protein